MSENLKNISRNVWEDIEPDSLNAMGILKVRYAKGDLTSEQFKTMHEDLKKITITQFCYDLVRAISLICWCEKRFEGRLDQ